MGIFNIYSEKIFGDTLIFNSIVFYQKSLFFLIFSHVILSLNFQLDFHNIKHCMSNPVKSSFFERRERIIQILEIKSKKNSHFINNFLFVKSKIIEIFSMKTKKNFYYFFEYIIDKDSLFLVNRIDIIKGLKILGFDKISFFKDFFFFTTGGNCILLGKLIFFPYFFSKILPFLSGHKLIKKIKIHPLIAIFLANNEYFYFYFISRKNKKFKFIQIGKKIKRKILSAAFTKLDLKKEFFLATINFQKIETYKIKFSVKKKFKSIKLCGMNEFLGTGNFLFVSWSEAFQKILLTGKNDGTIFLWNKILTPLIEIKNYWYSIKDIKIFNKSPIFFLILKKEKNDSKNFSKKKTFNNLPNTSIKIFIFSKNYHSNQRLFKMLIYFLNFQNLFWFYQKIFKKENFKKNISLKKSILSIIGKLSLIQSEKNTYYFSYQIFFLLKKTLSNYLSKKKNYCFESFLRQKFIFFRFFMLSRLRNLSIQEIKYEQCLINDSILKFYYFYCHVCQRINKNFRKKLKIFCFFFHNCKAKSKGWKKNKNYFYSRKIENEWDFRKKVIQFPIYTRSIIFQNIKFLFLQKEIWGIF